MNLRPRLCTVLVLISSFLFIATDAHAFPAFARKYGLRCSACHVAWPILNDFGWRFKDNGYQLMNDRDAPIWQNPSYWPVSFRMTPNWHRESADKVQVDTAAGPGTGEVEVTSNGFDNSGLDILAGGTLYKNISFLLVPSADETGAFHFESVWTQVNNLFHTPWVNIKFGKFELDNWISEKRIPSLSATGGIYQNYHFIPVGDNNFFAQLGDNQLGIQWLGHSANDHTRVSAALFSSNDGNPDLVNANTYSGYFSASQGFDVGGLGLQRVGGYYFVGSAPTYSLTNNSVAIPGSSLGTKGFYRAGFFGDFYISRFEIPVYYQHGSDSKYFGTATPANGVLPDGAQDPSWNGFFVEPRFIFNPQLLFFQRDEFVRMSQQALITNPSDLGNLDVYTFGVRWYPIMTSRAGFALHGEYSWLKQRKTAPVTGTDVTSSSVFFGTDFDF
jgi:hypothetical protein